MKIPVEKIICKGLALGLALATVFSVFPFVSQCEALPESIIRLRVVANSNSEADQSVKLLVRDEVILLVQELCSDCEDMQNANSKLCLNLEGIKELGNSVLSENGFEYAATVSVCDSFFPTSSYESFTLPAGRYRTLKITLGEGEGKNWWCVVFPSLCLPAAEDEEDFSALTEGQSEVIQNPQRYKVRFKLVELYEELRELLSQGGKNFEKRS